MASAGFPVSAPAPVPCLFVSFFLCHFIFPLYSGIFCNSSRCTLILNNPHHALHICLGARCFEAVVNALFSIDYG